MTRHYRRRGLVDRRRPWVLDVAPGLVHESGPERRPDWAPERVVVMAHWSTDPEPSRSVVTMLRELDAAGYQAVLVSAAEVAGPIGRVCTWAPGEPAMPEATTVLRRANVGYDFGSWEVVLEAFPGIRQAPRVLLVNDSLIGPFSGLGPVLTDFEEPSTPVWGLSGSLQHRPHVQSFFMGFRDGVLESPPMRAFWSDIRVESRKAKIVRYNELGLSEALDEAGIAWRTMFTPEPGGPQNPTIEDWDSLLSRGFPFVKAELVLAPPAWLDANARIDNGAGRIRARDLESWLPPHRELGQQETPPRARQLREHARTTGDIEGAPGVVRSAGRSAARRIRRMTAPDPSGARRG